MIHIDGVKDNMIANNVDPFEPLILEKLSGMNLKTEEYRSVSSLRKWVCPILFSTTSSTANVT